jgi:hypothetical protein
MLGRHMALMTGLPHTTGGLIFLSDSDLDEEPELMTRFHARFARAGVMLAKPRASLVWGAGRRSNR